MKKLSALTIACLLVTSISFAEATSGTSTVNIGNGKFHALVIEGSAAKSIYYALSSTEEFEPGSSGRVLVKYAGGIRCEQRTAPENYNCSMAFN